MDNEEYPFSSNAAGKATKELMYKLEVEKTREQIEKDRFVYELFFNNMEYKDELDNFMQLAQDAAVSFDRLNKLCKKIDKVKESK